MTKYNICVARGYGFKAEANDIGLIGLFWMGSLFSQLVLGTGHSEHYHYPIHISISELVCLIFLIIILGKEFCWWNFIEILKRLDHAKV